MGRHNDDQGLDKMNGLIVQDLIESTNALCRYESDWKYRSYLNEYVGSFDAMQEWELEFSQTFSTKYEFTFLFDVKVTCGDSAPLILDSDSSKNGTQSIITIVIAIVLIFCVLMVIIGAFICYKRKNKVSRKYDTEIESDNEDENQIDVEAEMVEKTNTTQ